MSYSESDTRAKYIDPELKNAYYELQRSLYVK
jgi:hypothetical protein